MPVLSALNDPALKLSKSARRVASRVLSDPAAVTRQSIAQLASDAGVSEPTVLRLCTRLGFRGFPAFKLELAAELAREESVPVPDVRVGDPMDRVLHTIFESARSTLQATRRQIDIAALERAVALLESARSIVLCGQGASGPVALDAQHKLLAFGIPVVAHLDAVQQQMCAAGLGEKDCLLCISYTGRSLAAVEVARIGRAAGAQVIGMTAPGSPLAGLCDPVLAVPPVEDTELYLPMGSRIAQLALIDTIVTGMALRRGPAFPARFREIKRVVLATRSPADTLKPGDSGA